MNWAMAVLSYAGFDLDFKSAASLDCNKPGHFG